MPPAQVFPEGTCTTGNAVVDFKRGAFVGGAPILPVALHYETASGMSAGWVGPLPTPTHVFRVLCEPWTAVTVTVLPLHVPTEAERQDVDAFAAAVQRDMASALQVLSLNTLQHANRRVSVFSSSLFPLVSAEADGF